MKNNTVLLVFSLVTLILSAAAEEILPKVLGIGFPFLLAGVIVMAMRPLFVVPVLFALAAGGLEDAISSLPFLTSASFFLLLAVFVRFTHLPVVATVVAFPLYQLWLFVWLPDLQGSIFSRILLSVPIGLITIGLVSVLLFFLQRKAAIDEEG